MVFLVILRHLNSLASIIYARDDFRKVRRTVELQMLQTIVVCSLDAVNAVAFRLETITIEREVMESLAWHYVRKLGTEAIGRDHLVLIVVLKDSAYCSQGLQILILSWVSIVQRVKLVLRAVRCREVNGHVQVNLAAAKDILEEVDDWLEFKADHVYLRTIHFQKLLALI